MITTIDAVYRDGAFYPTTPMDLPDGTVGIAIVQEPAILPPETLTPSGVLASTAKFDPEPDRPK